MGLSWESAGRIPEPCSGDSGEDIAKDIAKQDRENEDYNYTLGGKLQSQQVAASMTYLSEVESKVLAELGSSMSRKRSRRSSSRSTYLMKRAKVYQTGMGSNEE